MTDGDSTIPNRMASAKVRMDCSRRGTPDRTESSGMYMLLALITVALAYPAWFGGDKMNKPILYFFSAAFISGIFLCASKIPRSAKLFPSVPPLVKIISFFWQFKILEIFSRAFVTSGSNYNWNFFLYFGN